MEAGFKIDSWNDAFMHVDACYTAAFRLWQSGIDPLTSFILLKKKEFASCTFFDDIYTTNDYDCVVK